MTKSPKRRSAKKEKITLEPLTLKDAIETLIVYDVEHCRFPHNYLAGHFGHGKIPSMGGLALDPRKLILVDRERGTEAKRMIIIHELLHTKHFRKGDLKNNMKFIEDVVEGETKLTYAKLYGPRP
ncbi:hypothetical protein KKG48_03260 [Patescibacteria group bacterium]|nr:hypothetical protein [Patescibacteria group bacterium]